MTVAVALVKPLSDLSATGNVQDHAPFPQPQCSVMTANGPSKAAQSEAQRKFFPGVPWREEELALIYRAGKGKIRGVTFWRPFVQEYQEILDPSRTAESCLQVYKRRILKRGWRPELESSHTLGSMAYMDSGSSGSSESDSGPLEESDSEPELPPRKRPVIETRLGIEDSIASSGQPWRPVETVRLMNLLREDHGPQAGSVQSFFERLATQFPGRTAAAIERKARNLNFIVEHVDETHWRPALPTVQPPRLQRRQTAGTSMLDRVMDAPSTSNRPLSSPEAARASKRPRLESQLPSPSVSPGPTSPRAPTVKSPASTMPPPRFPAASRSSRAPTAGPSTFVAVVIDRAVDRYQTPSIEMLPAFSAQKDLGRSSGIPTVDDFNALALHFVIHRPNLDDPAMVKDAAEVLANLSNDHRHIYWWQAFYFAHAQLFSSILPRLPRHDRGPADGQEHPWDDFNILLNHLLDDHPCLDPDTELRRSLERLHESKIGKHHHFREWMAMYWAREDVFRELYDAVEFVAQAQHRADRA
ncbi:hypothetical protein DL93DRAFT_2086918 [Clavulina sp. PMI_390]|nr:hypothetical protein DL93DRAFT_2086918 [Clavulina sp. PMI_390]